MKGALAESSENPLVTFQTSANQTPRLVVSPFLLKRLHTLIHPSLARAETYMPSELVLKDMSWPMYSLLLYLRVHLPF